jgi:hypothetical protein
MKTTKILILFLILNNTASGQQNSLRSKLIDEKYTWKTVSTDQIESYYFDLQPIQTSKFESHFRISLPGQIIDFYTSEKSKYIGTLTNHTTEYKNIKIKNTNFQEFREYQYLIEKIELDTEKVNEIVEMLISSQIQIPTDSLIPSWQQNFLDYNEIIFQFKIAKKYKKQTYHCIWSQKDDAEFKNTIFNNYQTLNSTFHLDSLYKNFEGKLKNGITYSRDGYIMTNKMTKKQSNIWSKSQPKRDYLKSIKDSVDNYLNSELKKKNIILKDIDCFGDYQLIFSLKGKLKKINLNKQEKPTLKESFGLSV